MEPLVNLNMEATGISETLVVFMKLCGVLCRKTVTSNYICLGEGRQKEVWTGC
jgi:hypothetical protein